MSKLPYIIRPEITIDELIDLKRKNPDVSIRKLPPFGLTLEQYGHVYDVEGYRVIVKGDPDEIIRRLIEEAKRVEDKLKEKYVLMDEWRRKYVEQAVSTLRHALQDESHAIDDYANLITQNERFPTVQKILTEIRTDEQQHKQHLTDLITSLEEKLHEDELLRQTRAEAGRRAGLEKAIKISRAATGRFGTVVIEDELGRKRVLPWHDVEMMQKVGRKIRIISEDTSAVITTKFP